MDEVVKDAGLMGGQEVVSDPASQGVGAEGPCGHREASREGAEDEKDAIRLHGVPGGPSRRVAWNPLPDWYHPRVRPVAESSTKHRLHPWCAAAAST